MAEAWLEEIPTEECVNLLRSGVVGRIGIVYNDRPLVLPVNYRVIDVGSQVWIIIRTRTGNVIDRAGPAVALEVDGVDVAHERGWSVMVAGGLYHVDVSEEPSNWSEAHSWIVEDRESWLIIKPDSITGRRLQAATREWAFHPSAYLAP